MIVNRYFNSSLIKDSFKVTYFSQTVLIKYAKPLSKHGKDKYKDLLKSREYRARGAINYKIIFFGYSVLFYHKKVPAKF